MATEYLRAFVERASGDGPIRVIASTQGRKADGLDLRMAGVRLERFRSNPVVLWAHNRTALPVGRADAFVQGDVLIADITFDPEDDFARKIERKFRAGYLNAVSVGFEVDRVDREGVVNDWELLEISAVPVPADPAALTTAGRAAMRTLGEELLDLASEPAEEPTPPAITDEIVAAVVARLEEQGFVRSAPSVNDDRTQEDAAPALDPDEVARFRAALDFQKENTPSE